MKARLRWFWWTVQSWRRMKPFSGRVPFTGNEVYTRPEPGLIPLLPSVNQVWLDEYERRWNP